MFTSQRHRLTRPSPRGWRHTGCLSSCAVAHALLPAGRSPVKSELPRAYAEHQQLTTASATGDAVQQRDEESGRKERCPWGPSSRPSGRPVLHYVTAVPTKDALPSLGRGAIPSAPSAPEMWALTLATQPDFQSHGASLRSNCPWGPMVVSIQANVLFRFLPSG